MAEVIASGRAAREVIGAQEILQRFLMSLDRRGASDGPHEKRSGAVLARASGMEMEVDDTMKFKHHTPSRRSGSSDAGGATRWRGKSGHHRAGGPPPPLRPGCHLRLRLQPRPENAPDASPPIPRGAGKCAAGTTGTPPAPTGGQCPASPGGSRQPWPSPGSPRRSRSPWPRASPAMTRAGPAPKKRGSPESPL